MERKLHIALFIVLYFFSFGFCEIGIKLGSISQNDIINNKTSIDMKNLVNIFNDTVLYIKDCEAVLSWDSDTTSINNVKYGLKYPLEYSLIDMDKVKKHTVKLSNLKSGKKYFYEISDSNTLTGTFITTGIPHPEVINIKDVYISDSNIRFIFEFNVPVKGILYYWKVLENDSKYILYDNYSTFLYVNLDKLKNTTAYYFMFCGYDEFNRKLESEKYKFTTKENNIALFKKVEGTFSRKMPDMFDNNNSNSDNDILKRITDNSTNYFKGIATSQDLNDTEQWIIIDLVHTFKLKLVMAYWRKLCYPTNYTLEISLDKSNWRVIQSNLNAGKGFEIPSDSGDPMLVVMSNCGNIDARYIKILVKKNAYKVKHIEWNFVQLNEVKVFSN